MIETTELYDGQVTLEFNPGRHSYVIINKGKRYKVPSVTAICGIIAKPALVGWAVNSTLDVCKSAIASGVEYAESYLDAVWSAAKRSSTVLKSDAARRGTELHNRIESELATDTGLSQDAWSEDSRRWFKSFRFREIERRIYSRRYRYSGTLDAIAEDSTGLVLLDWKTSKAIYPEFRLQTAAYQAAWEEEHPDQPISGRYLVRISDEGIEPHYFPRSTFRKDFNAFCGALALYNRLQQIERQK